MKLGKKVEEVVKKDKLKVPVDLNKILKREEIELKKINKKKLNMEKKEKFELFLSLKIILDLKIKNYNSYFINYSVF